MMLCSENESVVVLTALYCVICNFPTSTSLFFHCLIDIIHIRTHLSFAILFAACNLLVCMYAVIRLEEDNFTIQNKTKSR